MKGKKVDSFPTLVEGRMEWRVTSRDAGDAGEAEEGAEEDDPIELATLGPEVAVGFIADGDTMYSVELDPELLTAAGIADLGVEGVNVRATLGGKSPMRED